MGLTFSFTQYKKHYFLYDFFKSEIHVLVKIGLSAWELVFRDSNIKVVL